MSLSIIIKAILLGIIEGLTEFIPVSSTAHLLLSSQLIDFSLIKDGVFEVVIQMGATLAVCFFYRQKLLNIFLSFNHQKPLKDICRNPAFNVFVAFLPAVIFGLLFHKIIKSLFFNSTSIAIALIIGGLIILLVEKLNIKPKYTELEQISIKQSLKIGLFQVLAMIPGVSRSGATIIGGLFLKLDRKTAIEFSFFLSIPTIFAASVFDFYQHYQSFDFNKILIILIGFVAAFFSSLLVIKWFINFISKNNFTVFAYYRIGLGLILLSYIYIK